MQVMLAFNALACCVCQHSFNICGGRDVWKDLFGAGAFILCIRYKDFAQTAQVWSALKYGSNSCWHFHKNDFCAM